ncbi:MAG: type II secretion system protein [Alphaproteobacteria bacterium]|nr:type II secretion system protein [Alphaproteobacteria bacterium]
MRIKENGRSMVEMLGVLAIVGILSAGALAGYSKAMRQHKLNKQMDEMNVIIGSIVKNIDTLAESPGLANVSHYLVKMGEIPSEMVKTENKDYLYDSFGNRMYVYHDTIAGRTITFRANIVAMNDDSPLAYQICRNFILVAKAYSFAISQVETLSAYGTDNAKASVLFGDRFCSQGICLRKVTNEQIEDACTKHRGNTNPEFKIKFFY